MADPSLVEILQNCSKVQCFAPSLSSGDLLSCKNTLTVRRKEAEIAKSSQLRQAAPPNLNRKMKMSQFRRLSGNL